MSIKDFSEFEVTEAKRAKKIPTDKELKRAGDVIVSKINRIAPKVWTVVQNSSIDVVENKPQNETLIMGLYTLSVVIQEPTINTLTLKDKTHRQINKIIAAEFIAVGVDMSDAKFKNNGKGYIGVSIFNDISDKVNESLDEAKSEEHYSEAIIQILIKKFGWKKYDSKTIKKKIIASKDGEVNPTGESFVFAGFDSSRNRYIEATFGFRTILDMDGRVLLGAKEKDYVKFAKEFDTRVTKELKKNKITESLDEAKSSGNSYTKKDFDAALKKFYKATGLSKSDVKSTFQQNGDVVALELEFSKDIADKVSRKIVADVFDKKGDRMPAQFIIGKKVANVLKFVYVED